MTTPSLNGTSRPIASAVNGSWREHAACAGSNADDFFSDTPGTQRRVRSICHNKCPALVRCLTTILEVEGERGYKWGVHGGLTADQRRALRCEAILGNVPDLAQARMLTSLKWRHVLYPMRYRGANPAEMAQELEAYGLSVSPVTVRIAVWWLGGRAPVMPRRGAGDRRPDWQMIRDECRTVVLQLRDGGATGYDIAAYLNVRRGAVEEAVRSWNKAACAADAEVELAA